jgi:mono/diheme cytochrome c family protein
LPKYTRRHASTFLNVVRGWKWFSLLMKRSNVIARLAIICLLLATSAGLAEDSGPSPLERRGRALAERMCSQCHAIGKRGRSPHVGAPAFRALDRRVDLDTFTDRLREGLMADHPDMPTFRFSREDARAFLLYLRSIQAP